ncbi:MULTISPECIES: hypothetical protein [unclassified Pseudoxanthomonas]|uniref:hypothetical protein n=1 Tax=unclassified Pseudoxanthomonas TaxID=2645906 RepID=UPI0030774B50
MRKKSAAGLLFGLWLASFVAVAQSPYTSIEQRLSEEQLREVGLTPAQLDLLNRMLREAEEKQAPRPAVGSGSSASVTSEGDRQTQKMFIGLDDQPIKSRVRGPVSGWEPGTVFALDNGQQWKVLKGNMKLPKTLDAPEIVVVPGIAGRWFLQVDEDMPKARVYRID